MQGGAKCKPVTSMSQLKHAWSYIYRTALQPCIVSVGLVSDPLCCLWGRYFNTLWQGLWLVPTTTLFCIFLSRLFCTLACLWLISWLWNFYIIIWLCLQVILKYRTSILASNIEIFSDIEICWCFYTCFLGCSTLLKNC